MIRLNNKLTDFKDKMYSKLDKISEEQHSQNIKIEKHNNILKVVVFFSSALTIALISAVIVKVLP